MDSEGDPFSKVFLVFSFCKIYRNLEPENGSFIKFKGTVFRLCYRASLSFSGK